jgi:hypothetical protein
VINATETAAGSAAADGSGSRPDKDAEIARLRHDIAHPHPLAADIVNTNLAAPLASAAAGPSWPAPRHRPDALFADRAYDHDKYRKAVRAKGIRPIIARRVNHTGPGRARNAPCAWCHGMERLRIRWERRDDVHEAFLALAAVNHHVPKHGTTLLGALREAVSAQVGGGFGRSGRGDDVAQWVDAGYSALG